MKERRGARNNEKGTNKTAKYCNIKKERKTQAKRRMELKQVMALTPRLHPAPQRAKISFNRLRQRIEMDHCGGTVGVQHSEKIATKQTH